MKMKLYQILPEGGQEVFISAAKTDDAAALYITHLEEQGLHDDYEFSVERFDTRVKGDWQASMEKMLSKGLSGIATYSDASGWSVKQP